MKKHDLPWGSVELPDNWEDSTAYQFVSPPAPGLEARLALGKGVQVASGRTSVVISRATIPAGMEIQGFLQQQAESLKRGFPGFVLHGNTSFNHRRAGKVSELDVSFETGLGAPVRQRQFYFPLEPPVVFVTLTISCHAPHYDRRRAEIEEICQTFEVKGTSH